MSRFKSLQFRFLRRKVERRIQQAYQGRYKYKGLIGYQPRWMPLGYVRYPDGSRSTILALGTAVDYMKLFGGKVVHAHFKS